MKYVSFCFVDVDVVGIGAVVDVVVHGAVVVDFLNTEVSGVEPLDYSARSSGYPPSVSLALGIKVLISVIFLSLRIISY